MSLGVAVGVGAAVGVGSASGVDASIGVWLCVSGVYELCTLYVRLTPVILVSI